MRGSKDDLLPHVLLVVDQFGQSLGGGERVALRIAAELPRFGYRASILTFSAHSECAALQAAPCPVYVLPLRRTYDSEAFRAAMKIRWLLKQQKIQIVQTFFESSDLWAGLVIKATSSAKLIWSRRDMGILRTGKHRIGYRLMAGLPDAVFAVSGQVAKHCIEVDRIDRALVQTIYNGLDLDVWDSAAEPRPNSRPLVIATVGNIRRVKGHDILVKAAKLVLDRFPDVSFHIAGEVLEPEYYADLQALIREYKISDCFHFAGGLKDPRNFLLAADIFVLPSRSEGFSNAIIEAMAASLAVVATDVGGNSEAVEDGVTGLLVPTEDPSALASAISRLILNPAELCAMGAAARAAVEEKFTTEVMMRRITDTYAQLLDPR
ncbi:MAG TPA: glycosyltransferase family 4 protein [Acidobacteriaceae bacterium]|nr:glycosyltransferase family 4 protein [Acidobacteriaceae bacterium]